MSTVRSTSTSNNQRLWSAGDNDLRSNTFAPTQRQMVKTHVIRLRGVEGQNPRHQTAFCALHSFLVEVQTKAGYINATHV